MPTVPTFAVRETDVSRHNGGTRSAPIIPRDVSLSDSKCWNLVAKTQRWAKMGYAIRLLLCRETPSSLTPNTKLQSEDDRRKEKFPSDRRVCFVHMFGDIKQNIGHIMEQYFLNQRLSAVAYPGREGEGQGAMAPPKPESQGAKLSFEVI